MFVVVLVVCGCAGGVWWRVVAPAVVLVCSGDCEGGLPRPRKIFSRNRERRTRQHGGSEAIIFSMGSF